MNTYEDIRYEEFRKKYAYEKSIDLIIRINKIIGICDTKDKAQMLKSTAKISTEIALAIGSILSTERRDFHFKVAIRQAYEVSKLTKQEVQFKDYEGCTQIIEDIIRLLRTYRKNLRLKETKKLKKVDVADKLDLTKIEDMVNKLKNFRLLKAYEIMINFYTRLYAILKNLPYFEQYSIFSQAQRAAESILANLAEGNARGSVGYKLVEANFYSISFGSAVEVSAWLDIMKIKGYISGEEHLELEGMLQEIKKLIITYLKNIVKENREAS